MITNGEAPPEPGSMGPGFRLLHAGAWIALLAALLALIGLAVLGQLSGPVIGLAALGLVLLLVVARLLAAQAAARAQHLFIAAQQERDFERLVEVRTRELSELSTHLQLLAEQEKSDLARHLHDELGGLLTAAKMDLSWLQSRVTEQTQYLSRLTQLGNMLDEAMDLKRRVVEQLRPSLLDHFGLPTALRTHVEEVCRKADLQYEVSMVDEVEALPRESAIALFRVIQEGLSNIIRHAHARQVRLAFTSDPKRYLLLLVDDGCGIKLDDMRFRWSHGLTGMRHRVQALGGRFSLESSPAEGTTLRVELPRKETVAIEAGQSLAH